MLYTSHTRSLAFLILALAVFCSPARACSTPVFRYALERWAPDAYELVILHRGDLNPDQQKRVKAIVDHGTNALASNLIVEVFDLQNLEGDGNEYLFEQMPEVVREAAAHVKAGQTCVLALLPDSLRKRMVLWSGTLEALPFDELVDSPVRRDIARRLLKGASVVWVQVDGPDEKRNAEAFAKLEKLLRGLEKEMQPPAPVEGEAAEPAPEVKFDEEMGGMLGQPSKPVEIRFEALRIKRGAPGEALFLEQLFQTNPGTAGAKEALVFPIFGRGRVLECLAEKEINEDVIGGASYYLAGACSCEIKAQNPGFDLLMSVGWDHLLTEEHVVDKALPPLAGVGGTEGLEDAPAAQAEAVSALPAVERTHQAGESTSLVWISAVAALGLLGLGVLVATLVLRTRSS